MTPQEIQEYIKCAKDPVYFLNNYGYVYDIRKSRVDKLSCFNYQENALKNYIKYQNNIVLKSRQTGMSVITAGIVVWMLLFKMDQRILIVANDGAGAVRFLGTVKQYFQFLPKFLFDPDTQAEKDNEKFFSIKNPEGKISWVKAVASSKNAGRGESLTMLILDETAFIENAEDIWMAAGLALSATQGKCIMISCVPKETFVFTDKGLKQIKNFIKEEEKEGYLVDDYLVLGKDKLRTGNLFFNNGFQKTKKIFGTNSFLEGTLTHKIWGYKNGKFDWYKLEELDTEDYFSIQYGNEIFGNNDFIKDFKPSINGKIKNIFNPTIITKEIAYLIGLYIAEGSVYKKYKEEKFIGGVVTITCGDDISNSILNAGLNFSNSDGIHYCIGSKNFIEFLEYLGFDLTKKAKQKEIPSRVLEMSKENIISMLRGMFDGDGCSRKDKGYISYTSSSKTLAEQVRMLLLNFGILTDFQTTETKPTKKVKVKSIRHCIESNAEYSKVFYDKIGFNLKRKQDNEIILEKYNLLRNNPNDIIPDGLKLVEKIIIESKVELKELKKEITQIYSFINSKREYKTNNLSRKIVLKIYDICKKYLSSKTINELDRILCNNLKWNKINKIEFSEKETFDFSLPENDDDFWCHSVIYNGILGHQTPQGTGNLYHKTWIATKKGESDFVPFQIHWTEHPVYSLEKEQRTDDYGRTYWTSPWYEKECERLQYDRVKIAQELDLSFEGSRQLVIESGIIEKYKRSIINEKPELFYDYTKSEERFISTKTNFWVWKKPEHGKNYIIGCLPPNEKVLTDSGLKNVEDVNQFDKLINENGDCVKIINKQIYEVENENNYKFTLSNTFRKTTFTKEHPLLTSKPTLKRNYLKNNSDYKFNERYWDLNFEFIKAENVKIGDWVKIPNIYKKDLKYDINKYWNFNGSESSRIDFRIKSPLEYKEFWWFVGLWLGDGWLGKCNNSHSITICFNKKEIFYVEKTIELIKNLFDRSASLVERDYTFDVTFNNKELYWFLLNNFGQYSYGKKIPEWVKFIKKESKIELLKGYFDSDGCWIKTIKNNKINSKISFVSINLDLLESIQDILFSIGIISSLNKLRNHKIGFINERKINQKECYNLCLANYDSIKLVELFNDIKDIKLLKFNLKDFKNKNRRIISNCFFDKNEDFIYFQIKDIEKSNYTGKVYNFECDTHTFLCHHITTHNCDVARGDSKDFSTVEVFDADTCEQVAEYQGKIPPDVFGSLIDRVGRDYNNAYLVIECNSFGLATTLNIKNALKYPEDRIYHSKSIKDIINPSAKVRIKENDDIPGIQTTQITRPLIISSLNSYMREGKIKINSVRLLEEFDTFIYNGNKPEHADGFNDDLIFALGVLLFVRDTEYFKNFTSRDLYKAMIESISNQRTGIGEKINLDAKSTEGVILTSRNTKADDDNDISWLISS